MLVTATGPYRAGTMNQTNIILPDPPPLKICLQPGCLLKKTGVDAEYLANFIVHALAGESLDDFFPESDQIEVHHRCELCALRVLEGGKAYVTEAEYDHLVDVGERHRIRWWRRKQRSF